MTFTVKSLEQDVLCITVFDRDLFSPNGKVTNHERFLFCNRYFCLFVCFTPMTISEYFFFTSLSDFLGRTELSLAKLSSKGRGPWHERLLLHEVETGEVVVRIELHLEAT